MRYSYLIQVVYNWHPGEMLSTFQGKAEGSKGEWAAFWKKKDLEQPKMSNTW